MLPAPCPDTGVGAVIQFASEDAFQLHSGCVLTATVVLAPPASIDAAGAVSVTAHFAGDGPVEVATVEPQPADAQATHHAITETRRFVRCGCEARSSFGQNDRSGHNFIRPKVSAGTEGHSLSGSTARIVTDPRPILRPFGD